jgi:hypothetical protein
MQTETTPGNPTVRILIVDDEASQMKALCDTLRDRGYHTTGFTSAKAALADMAAQKFDLVLTDLMMPEMDGISLLKQALQIDNNLVGIIMTGEGTITTAVEAMKTGAFDYILKPFRLSVILPVLSRALAMRQLRMDNAALEAGIRRRTAELEAANNELEAFSYSVSHDLRAPLRHICGYLEALKEDSDTKFSDSSRRFMGAIGKSADLMSKLIENLLEFSRLGRTEMHQRQFSMEELVREVIAEMSSDTQGRNIEWDVQSLPAIHGDRSMLKQVWVNLLSNAVKYTRPRDPAKIFVCCENKDGEWVFRVRDNGVGFNMANVDKLFGVFQRLHDASEFEGTGVGLANVRRTIARHGGRAWAEGKVDEGACVFFTLPIQAPQVAV